MKPIGIPGFLCFLSVFCLNSVEAQVGATISLKKDSTSIMMSGKHRDFSTETENHYRINAYSSFNPRLLTTNKRKISYNLTSNGIWFRGTKTSYILYPVRVAENKGIKYNIYNGSSYLNYGSVYERDMKFYNLINKNPWLINTNAHLENITFPAALLRNLLH